jgi:uncharacterized protein YggE
MKRQSLLSVLLMGILGLAVLSGCAAPAAAQTPVPADTPRTITVSGTGVAYGSPDIATAQVGVQTRGEDPGQAMEDNNTRMAALIAALKAAGIADQDIQTTNFSVYAQQDYNPQTGETLETITYVVDNTVNITVRDLARLGDVLSGAVDAGANSVYGVSFSVDNRSALEQTAREQAMTDARARAEALADLAGVTLDAPLSITENFGGAQPIFEARDMAAQAGGSAVPVQTGQIAVNLNVSVTYIIR